MCSVMGCKCYFVSWAFSAFICQCTRVVGHIAYITFHGVRPSHRAFLATPTLCPSPKRGPCMGQRNPFSMLKQPSLRDVLPGRALRETEFPPLLRESWWGHTGHPKCPGSSIPKSDILLSQGRGESWSHKQAQFNSPSQAWKGPRGSTYTTPHPILSRAPWQEPLTHLQRWEITMSQGCQLHLQVVCLLQILPFAEKEMGLLTTSINWSCLWPVEN